MLVPPNALLHTVIVLSICTVANAKLPETPSSAAFSLFNNLVILLLVGCSLSLVPGYLLASPPLSKVLLSLPGVTAALIPLTGIRGNVLGCLASHVSSMFALDAAEHAEQGEESRDPDHARLWRHVRAATSLARLECSVLALGIPFFALLTPDGITVDSFARLVSVCVISSFALASTLTALATRIFVLAHRRSVQPDTLALPILSSCSDLATLPILLAVVHVTSSVPTILLVAGATASLAVAGASHLAVSGVTISDLVNNTPLQRQQPLRTSTELAARRLDTPWHHVYSYAVTRLPILAGAALLAHGAGVQLEASLSDLSHDRLAVSYVALLPLLAGAAGSVGSLVASRASTAALSSPPTRLLSVPLETSIVVAAATIAVLTVTSAYASVSPTLAADLRRFVAVVPLTAAALSTTATALAHLAVRLSLSLSLSPDDVAVPAVTASADFLSALVYCAVVRVLVGGQEVGGE
jgi:cation transporter-like permease